MRTITKDLDEIIIEHSRANYVHPSDVRSKTRKRPYPQIREAIAVEAFREGFLLVEIGNYLNRHHSTVIHMLERHRKRLRSKT